MNDFSTTAFLIERLPELGQKTLEHLFLTCFSTFLATVIGLPLGIWIVRNARIRGWVLGAVGVLQTMPSLAMLAFLLPFFGIGVAPALAALTLYALLPIVRNTYTGIQGVPGDILEAADGLGFTSGQRLRLIELPLALPVILAGIRTAMVIGVGIAALSAFIGAGGLGDFIVRGLAQTNNPLILLGAIPSAILALTLDYGIGIIERLADRKQRSGAGSGPLIVFSTAAACLIAALTLTYIHMKTDLFRSSKQPVIRIGAKNFSEQFILGEMMAQIIEDKTSLDVDRRFNLGGTMICHEALIHGEIDLYAEYTGTALLSILHEDGAIAPENVYSFVKNIYREKFDCLWLAPLGFNNTYAITVRSQDALAKGWRTISDLAPAAGSLRLGIQAEFYERPDGYPGLKNAYSLDFAEVRELDPGLVYGAIAQGEVDVISAFATDGRIAAYRLTPLIDDKTFFPPYHCAPLIRGEIARRHPEVLDALALLADALDEDAMRRLNYRVDEENRSTVSVAQGFLREQNLLAAP
ncbi:MAG: ABC transporter permease subunit [Candidatus Omnitrophica bacterium]|nr:ABC transporter permease subunit [Candidatus Omnitrophota bacterium]